jgi:hypothetical protein
MFQIFSALALTWHLFDFYIFSQSIILNMIILQPVSSSESSSQKSMILGFMTLLSIQFSLQYSFSILTTCSSAFVHTSFVIFQKAAYVSSFTYFNRKVVLFLATKPLTCAHINSIGLSSQCRTGVLNTSRPCILAILFVL